MTVFASMLVAVSPAPAIDSELEWNLDRLKTIDEAMAGHRKIEAELRAAEQAKATAQANADDMGAAVAQQTIERIRKTYKPEVYGQLSGQKTKLVNDFCNSGPESKRQSELKSFLELFGRFADSLREGRDMRAAAASNVAGEVTPKFREELGTIRRNRLALLGVSE